MTLGSCPLSIFCSRGTPPRAKQPGVYHRRRARREQLERLQGRSSENGSSHSQNMDLTVLFVPNALDSGLRTGVPRP